MNTTVFVYVNASLSSGGSRGQPTRWLSVNKGQFGASYPNCIAFIEFLVAGFSTMASSPVLSLEITLENLVVGSRPLRGTVLSSPTVRIKFRQ
ncbi:hypothetical protein J6590_092647 [Homalodisca vitripennis]|nr:hypothetical protein J6590_092647 [Homalodisca vitripennis]